VIWLWVWNIAMWVWNMSQSADIEQLHQRVNVLESILDLRRADVVSGSSSAYPDAYGSRKP
jgi:hypothetical protein